MTLQKLVERAIEKPKFRDLADYLNFCADYLKFIDGGLQASIVSQNENHYRFFQYRKDGYFNITRPINSNLMLSTLTFEKAVNDFKETLKRLSGREKPSDAMRANFLQTIYTIQQSIGATLDALPSGRANQARKINGDLFERLIRILIVSIGVECVSGTMQVPVKDDDGVELFWSSYQHDLLISEGPELKVIGSVKTSSKDRIDKVFLDKFLFSKLTQTALPHIAIFLNDVQRKKSSREGEYGINATFLAGHFKAYTIKLNPLDGIYYCDIRPNMRDDAFLKSHIKTLDHLFYSDLWKLLSLRGKTMGEVAILSD